MDRLELAARLIDARQAADLTQEEVARRARLSPSTVSGLESAKVSRPHFRTLHKIGEALGIDVADLLREHEPPKVPRSREWMLAGPEDGGPAEDEFDRSLREVSDETLRDWYRELKNQPHEERKTSAGHTLPVYSELVRGRKIAVGTEMRRRNPAQALLTKVETEDGREVKGVWWLVPEEERPAVRERLAAEFGEDGYIEMGDSIRLSAKDQVEVFTAA